jgi:hypothetical protein
MNYPAGDVISVNSLSNEIPLRGLSPHPIAAARARRRQGVARRPHPKVCPRSPHLPVRRHRRWGRGRAAGGGGVATEAPLTSKVTIPGWGTKRLKGRRNIFLNQPTDLTLGEGQRGRIVRLSGGMVTLQDAVDAFSARAACHVLREAPRKFSITPSRRPLRAAVASGANFPGCAPHQDRVAPAAYC